MARTPQLQQPVDDLGPVPEDNQPGHHPTVDQDKPTGPPPVPRSARAGTAAAGAKAAGVAKAGGAAKGARAVKAAPTSPVEAVPDAPRRFSFAFEPLMVPAAALVGVLPSNTRVEVDAEELVVRFGRWSMRVPRDDIESATATGPFDLIKVIGPPRLSLADRGVTFATNRRAGVCISLRRSHGGIDPLGLIKHPGITVTVTDPDELCALLNDGA